MGRVPNEFPFEVLEKHGHYHFRTIGDLSMQAVFRLRGRLDVEQVNRALRLCVARYPILGCGVKVGVWKLRWVMRTDLEHIRWCDLVETTQVDEELHRFNLIRCAPWEGDPLVQARLIRGPDGDVLCLKSNHAVSDAIGFKEMIYAFCDFFEKLQNEPHFVPDPQLDCERSMGQIVKDISWIQAARLFFQARRDDLKLKEPPIPFGFPFVVGDRAERRFLSHSFPAVSVERMKGYARARGASFNDLLNTLFAHAVYARFSPGRAKPLLYFNAIDLRRYSRAVRKIEGPRNLSTFAVFKVIPAENADFDSLLKTFSDRVKLLRRASAIGLGGYFQLKLRNFIPNRLLTQKLEKKWKKYEPYVKKGIFIPSPILLSSVGKIDEKRLSFPGAEVLEARMLPPVFDNWCFFVYSSYRDAVTVSVGFCDPEKMEPLLREIFEAIDQKIQTF